MTPYRLVYSPENEAGQLDCEGCYVQDLVYNPIHTT
jgi:hypothetical protein